MDFLLAFILCFSLVHGYKPKNPVCGENEEFTDCGSPCNLNCTNYNNPKLFCIQNCKEGCFCKPDFIRDSNGKCIHPEECPKESSCPYNERYVRCVNICNDCWNKGRCDQEYSYCQPGCDCKPGHFRNAYGMCIPENQCFKDTRCKENEEYSECFDPCNYCDIDEPCKYPCEPGCECKKGYTRDEFGKCIPSHLCYRDTTCGVNEEYLECPDPCNFCYVQEACKYPCDPGCDCKKGYTRDENGACIRKDLCSKEGICGKNEEHSKCPDPCNYCDTQESCKYPCEPGCDCKKGYHRNDNGSCIPFDLCSKIFCKENETYLECGSLCPATCDNSMEPRLCSQRCSRGCFCKQNYVKSRDGKCILRSECPRVKNQTCPQNQHFFNCMPTCRTCKNFNSTSVVECSSECRPGCFCKKGLVKRSDGMCVTPAECPKPLCRNYEEYLECGSPCPITCENYPKWPVICQQQCIEGCFCVAGYVRNPNGDCVRPRECPSVTSGSNQTTPIDEQPGVIDFRRGFNGDETDDITTMGIQDKATTNAGKTTTNIQTVENIDDQTATIPTIQSKTDDQTSTNAPATQKTEPATSVKGDTATESTKRSTSNVTETKTPLSTEHTIITTEPKTTNTEMKSSGPTTSKIDKSTLQTSQTKTERNEAPTTNNPFPIIETVNSSIIPNPEKVTVTP